jgi:hypothetical protein
VGAAVGAVVGAIVSAVVGGGLAVEDVRMQSPEKLFKLDGPHTCHIG